MVIKVMWAGHGKRMGKWAKASQFVCLRSPPGTGELHWGRMNNFGRVEGSKVLGNTA